MKKTFATLMLLAGVAMGNETLLSMDFTALTGSTNDNTPAGWTAGQWNGNGNTPYYNFGENGATVGQSWKQNYLTTNMDIASQGEAVGRDYVCFQNGTKINPTVLDNSTGLNVATSITYTLTMLEGNMTINAALGNGSTWSTTITGMEDVTFTKLGFMNDGSEGTSGVKGITITAPAVPEPTTATLSLLALADLAARRRRK